MSHIVSSVDNSFRAVCLSTFCTRDVDNIMTTSLALGNSMIKNYVSLGQAI